MKGHINLTVLMLCVFALYCAQSFADQNTALVLNSTTNTPLSTPNSQGFLDLVASEALARMNINLHIVVYPAERALIDANAGILDGELSRIPGLEKTYTNLRLIPEKLMDLEFTIFGLNDISIKPGWEGLHNTSVAFLNGWKILEINVPKSADITKVRVPAQLFSLLSLKRVDYIIYEKWGGLALAKSMSINNVKSLQPPLAIKGMHIYLHKKHETLLKPLTAAIISMKKDGTYQKLYNQILSPIANKFDVNL